MIPPLFFVRIQVILLFSHVVGVLVLVTPDVKVVVGQDVMTIVEIVVEDVAVLVHILALILVKADVALLLK